MRKLYDSIVMIMGLGIGVCNCAFASIVVPHNVPYESDGIAYTSVIAVLNTINGYTNHLYCDGNVVARTNNSVEFSYFCGVNDSHNYFLVRTYDPAGNLVYEKAAEGWSGYYDFGNIITSGNTGTGFSNDTLLTSINIVDQADESIIRFQANFGVLPWQTAPVRIDTGIINNPSDPQNNAVVITHGWNSDATTWVDEMAKSVCRDLVSAPDWSPDAIQENSLTHICTTPGWDVYVYDWRDKSGTGYVWWTSPSGYKSGASQAFHNAYFEGDTLGHLLSPKDYKHIHFIAHSAGSNAIDNATTWLKALAIQNHQPKPTIHATFLDAYHPNMDTNQYGRHADWADNYVDTRYLDLQIAPWDGTRLFLRNAFNVDVTPPYYPLIDYCHNDLDVDAVCRHSRPYRFYGMSIDHEFVGDGDYQAHDSISGTDSVGYILTVEKGEKLDTLNTEYKKGRKCTMSGDTCYPENAPRHWVTYWPGAVAQTIVDGVTGVADFTLGTANELYKLYKLLKLGAGFVGALNAQGIDVVGKSVARRATSRDVIKPLTAESPSWIVLQVTTTSPVNTLRFNWRFAEAGDGVLQVFVNDMRVRLLEQRYVPIASLQTESLSLGELPAGTYKIAFRLDGFGTNPSGVELTDVELGFEQLVAAALGAEVLNVDVFGLGKVTSAPAGIDCGVDCSEAYASGQSVSLTPSATEGAQFAGWSGECSGIGTCGLTMNATRSVQASFLKTAITGALPSGVGIAKAAVTGGWSVAPGGSGPLQTGGFISLGGHAKSPPVAPPAGWVFPYGLFDFVLTGGEPGSTATAVLTYPGPLPANSVYWKYGPTPDNHSPHWYIFPATLSGNTVVLVITDGGLGDDDLLANGVIVDAGGAAYLTTAESIPALSRLGLIMLSILMLVGVWGSHRRIGVNTGSRASK